MALSSPFVPTLSLSLRLALIEAINLHFSLGQLILLVSRRDRRCDFLWKRRNFLPLSSSRFEIGNLRSWLRENLARASTRGAKFVPHSLLQSISSDDEGGAGKSDAIACEKVSSATGSVAMFCTHAQ